MRRLRDRIYLPRPTQGARSNDKDLASRRDEPDDHAIGRSRGGLTTKTHAIVDGRGLPLVVAVTPGQAHDSPAMARLLGDLSIPRVGPGRPRRTPTILRADKAYSGRLNRELLQARGVTVVIPEKSDAIARRKARGARGGRPLDFDAEDYKNRNVVERAFNKLKNWRGIATRYDKHALVYRGGVVLASIMLWLA